MGKKSSQTFNSIDLFTKYIEHQRKTYLEKYRKKNNASYFCFENVLLRDKKIIISLLIQQKQLPQQILYSASFENSTIDVYN